MDVYKAYNSLKKYCESASFKGWDPYDGLNSKIFKAIPILRSNRIARLAWIQLFKRSPINFRRLLLVPKDYNNKGIGLFLAGYCKEYLMKPSEECKEKITRLADILINSQSKGYSGACWGYNFDWQARAFFQAKNTPTVVATTYIGYALLDAYEILNDERLLSVVRSSCHFILKDLNRTYDDKGNFAFSYSPLDKSVVFNASLLGSRLLSRVYSFTKEENLIIEAKRSVAFCCNYQATDGSWSYGTLPFHHWVDNFHTGFNLECISEYMKYSGVIDYEQNVEKGFAYYVNTFFTEEGIPKYYNNSTFPIDIHAPAQLVITLATLEKFHTHKQLLDKVIDWTIENMQSGKGYFYYQINRYFSSKISYMRWAQSWMFYALASYLHQEKIVEKPADQTLNSQVQKF